jgi:hypothetical protein
VSVVRSKVLATLGQRTHLEVIAPEEAELGPRGLLAREHGSREDADVATLAPDLPARELVERGSEARPQETRTGHDRARQRDDSLHRELTGGGEPPHVDHIRVAQVPRGARARDGGEAVDVDPGIPCRMAAPELLHLHGRVDPRRDRRALAHAEVGGASAQLDEQPQAALEVLARLRHDPLRIGGVWVGIDRGDEQGVGFARGVGHPAVGSRAQRHPQPRLDQELAHALGAPPFRIVGRPRREGSELVLGGRPLTLGLGELDHQRTQRPARAAEDRRHATGGGRRVADARVGAILEEQLATANDVALGHRELRAQARGVVAHHRHAVDGGSLVDRLLRRTGDRDLEALPDAVQRHVRDPSPRQLGIGGPAASPILKSAPPIR